MGPSGRIGALLDRVCAIVELAVLARVGIHVVCEGEARFDDQEDEGVVVDDEAPQARRQRQQKLREELGPLFFLEGPRLCVERGRRLQGGASLPGAIELLDSVNPSPLRGWVPRQPHQPDARVGHGHNRTASR